MWETANYVPSIVLISVTLTLAVVSLWGIKHIYKDRTWNLITAGVLGSLALAIGVTLHEESSTNRVNEETLADAIHAKYGATVLAFPPSSTVVTGSPLPGVLAEFETGIRECSILAGATPADSRLVCAGEEPPTVG